MTKNKDNNYWKNKLSEESYRVTRESGLKARLPESIGILMNLVSITVYVATHNFLSPILSLMQAVDGQVFLFQ